MNESTFETEPSSGSEREDEIQDSSDWIEGSFESTSHSFPTDVTDYSNNVTQYPDENSLNSRRLSHFKKTYSDEFLLILREQDFEYGFDSQSDAFIRNLMNENRSVTKEWLNLLYIEYYDKKEIMIGILRVISHIEYAEISPQGPTMALAALPHADAEVRECGIRAFENWGNIESLNVLKNVRCQEGWLQSYVDQIIDELKEELGVNGIAR